MHSYLKHYIDGQWVESDGGTRHQVIDPSTEQPVTEITLGTAADVDKAVAAARDARSRPCRRPASTSASRCSSGSSRNTRRASPISPRR